MSATDELRLAAETLRMKAEVATVGPWEASERIVWSAGIDTATLDDSVVSDGPDGRGGLVDELDGAYIATMHPGVGLALATVLEETAETWDLMGTPEHTASEYSEFMHLARLINGGGE